MGVEGWATAALWLFLISTLGTAVSLAQEAGTIIPKVKGTTVVSLILNVAMFGFGLLAGVRLW